MQGQTGNSGSYCPIFCQFAPLPRPVEGKTPEEQ